MIRSMDKSDVAVGIALVAVGLALVLNHGVREWVATAFAKQQRDSHRLAPWWPSRYSGQMRAQRTHWGIGTSVILLAALAACSPTPTETSFARYYFEASETRGVLEVTKSPPTICYSTQSIPARPISIVRGSLAASPRAASFAPRENDFCGTVTPDLAAGLLAEPSGYSVRWRPLAGEPTAISSFIPIP
jgi:hypothetical protein